MLDCHYFSVSEWRLAEWEQTFAPLNVRGELEKMKLWLDANPRRRKKSYQRFVNNWLNKAHAQVLSAAISARYTNIVRQAEYTDKHGNRYRVTAEGSRQYI